MNDNVVRGRWFPASIVLPEYREPWRRCYVLAGDGGLYVYKSPSEDAHWHAGVDWSAVTLPRDDHAARRGFEVRTALGLAVVTLGTGCRCGQLGRWAGPLWARSEMVRA
jgi:hypothetical protein